MLTSLLGVTLALGLLGGLHCTLMCGPLISLAATAERSRSRGALRYLAGRFSGHVLAGAVLGQVGSEAGRRLSSSGLQLAVALSVAGFMLIRGLRLIFSTRRPPSDLVRLRRRPRSERLQAFVGSLVPRRALPLGLATSMLPCGLLAGGWALAASAAHPLHGAAVMAVFSVATAPGLLAALLVGLRIAHLASRVPAAWQGGLWCVLGILLGLRPWFERLHGCCN